MKLAISVGEKKQAATSRKGWRNIAAKLQAAGWPATQAIEGGRAIMAGFSAYTAGPLKVEVLD